MKSPKKSRIDGELRDYKKDPPVLNITQATLDRLLKEDKPDQLFALYLFYCYTSIWQATLQIYATTSYTAKALGWSIQKVQRVKRRLLELGLIEDVQGRKESGGKFSKQYIRIYYFTGHGVLRGAVKTGDKCLVTISNKCLDTISRQKTSGDRHSKATPSKNDTRRSKILQDIILTKINTKMNITGWPEIFRKLRQINKVSPERIKLALKWYAKNIGEQYVPVAHSAQSFREKFTRIEDAMNRQNHPIRKTTGDPEENEYNEYEDAMSKVKTRRLPDGSYEEYVDKSL